MPEFDDIAIVGLYCRLPEAPNQKLFGRTCLKSSVLSKITGIPTRPNQKIGLHIAPLSIRLIASTMSILALALNKRNQLLHSIDYYWKRVQVY